MKFFGIFVILMQINADKILELFNVEMLGIYTSNSMLINWWERREEHSNEVT